jgi:polyprenyl-phospho-N-acetylgalactosaminyl synthase
MKIFCVIPAFNEEKNIATVIDQVKPLVDTVVVVDDSSSDQTASSSAKTGVVLLKHIINRGQGAALRTGTEYCLKNDADIVVHFDADGQFLSKDIEKVVAPIKNGEAQVVFGSRFLDSAHSSEMPIFKKYFIMPLAKAVNKIFFNINLTDPQSGFRAMSSEAARKINWRQDRMAHCSEIMFEVKKNNFKVKEIPIRVIYHSFGQSFSGGLKILKELFIAMLVN